MGQALININGDGAQTLEILFLMTTLSLLPSIMVMMTSFTRIIIILSFLRNAMGVQQLPPNMVLIGISVFLTFFIMSPVIDDISLNAYTPYKNQEISQEQAIERAQVPLRDFMLRQTETGTLNMYAEFAGQELNENVAEIPMKIVVPAFMTTELKRAFVIGFLLFIPFMLIDLIVASTLMSMGMMMLPPAMISLPFKILLFITIDGWNLLFSTIIKGFN
ncbi:flagellar type III secretion system pore protein FliP [Proteocatella sphenisci]|uniref:flagellar type III secretion system pore protein FliP n=1 Tax=Proteocatella sphenisci TaxID=181070 RepID=UPI0004905AE7|nr:flagellar type III secretion system pore protein FliP [Proteocatella sphenisci]